MKEIQYPKESKNKRVQSRLASWSIFLCCIDKTTFDLVNENATNQKAAAKEKGDTERTILLAKIAKTDKVKALGKRNTELTIEQLKTLLAPLKWQGGKKMPTRKADMMKHLEEW